MNRNKTFLIDTVKEYCFLDSKFIQFEGGQYEVPFAIEPTEGEHSLDTCENCRKHRQVLIDELTEDFEKFPNCCKHHSKLEELPLFDKKDYEGIPTMIADKIIFSYHHIINNLDNDDWYEDIADYIEYSLESFGTLPYGYGEPFKWSSYVSGLKHLLKHIEDKISSDKIPAIDVKTRMNKVIGSFEPIEVDETNSKRDFNLLLSKYDEWYKIFPFDLPYFSHLKEKFRRTLPIYTGRTRYNKYLKTTKREIHTKDSFTVVLLRITKDIITSINGLSLYQEGLISDGDKHKLDLIINNRKLELYDLSSMPNKKKSDYVKILKTWFKEEKKFIEEITPLLNNNKPAVNRNQRPNRTDIAYYIHYMSETKLLKLLNPFPSDKAWKEIGKMYGKNPKNIQQAYNLINNNSDERLKKTKIGNITYVIEEMLVNDKVALQFANDELKLAQLNS